MGPFNILRRGESNVPIYSDQSNERMDSVPSPDIINHPGKEQKNIPIQSN